jgi:Tfp pilus assembly protein PilO
MTSEREITAAIPPVRRVRTAPKTGLVGVPEIIGLSLSALLLLATVVTYFYLVLPARARLRAQQSSRAESEKNIRTLMIQLNNQDTAGAVLNELVSSQANFEQGALGSRTAGRNELYVQLNEMIRQNGLRNTAGPSYTAMEALDPNAPASVQNKSGNARFQSLYPGIGVNVTVEGSYAGIRRFVHDVEAMPQFVIVNTVELEEVAANSSSAPSSPPVQGEPRMLTPRAPRPAPAAPSTATGAAGVSLRMDLSIYFRREGGAANP